MSWQYVKSKRGSWHRVTTPTRMFDTYRTRCGRTITSTDTREDEPLNEKGCESCARYTLSDQEDEA